MTQQGQKDLFQDFRKHFNFAYSFCTAYQRALIVPFRNKWGTQALGLPCLFAIGLMMLWYIATADPGMLAWMGFWLFCQAMRRIEAVRIAGQVHSHYDGWPVNLGSNERVAKAFYEPILVGILGGILYWAYTINGLRPTGLPYFFLGGIVALPFVESVKQTLWERRLQGMADAKLEQEMLMEDFKNRG